MSKAGCADHAGREIEQRMVASLELDTALSLHKVEEIDKKKHRFRPMHMEMINKQNKRRSEMVMDKIQLRPDVPDDYFKPRYLERG